MGEFVFKYFFLFQTSPSKRGPKKKQPQPVTPVEGSVCDQEAYLGLNKVTDNSFEIWLHEDCIVWGSGIHMIAGRLVGVEEAVWGSMESKCALCKKTGAVVCCLQRGCVERVHVPCAKQSNWMLDEEVLHSHCQGHRTTGENEKDSAAATTPSAAQLPQLVNSDRTTTTGEAVAGSSSSDR